MWPRRRPKHKHLVEWHSIWDYGRDKSVSGICLICGKNVEVSLGSISMSTRQSDKQYRLDMAKKILTAKGWTPEEKLIDESTVTLIWKAP